MEALQFAIGLRMMRRAANVADAVRSFKSGTREFRSEKNGVLQVPVGKKSMDAQKISGFDAVLISTDHDAIDARFELGPDVLLRPVVHRRHL